MSLEEGIEVMKKVFEEINTRFLIGGATFTLKVSYACFFSSKVTMISQDSGKPFHSCLRAPRQDFFVMWGACHQMPVSFPGFLL